MVGRGIDQFREGEPNMVDHDLRLLCAAATLLSQAEESRAIKALVNEDILNSEEAIDLVTAIAVLRRLALKLPN